MALTTSGLDSFASLAKALGLFKGDNPNADWFTDPMATGANTAGLKTILANDEQRNALVDFVDQALGPPSEHQQGDQTWVPLFVETDPALTIFAVLEPVQGAVRIGVALQHEVGDGLPHVKSTVHVPLFAVPRQGQIDTRPVGAPKWVLIGQEGGRITISVDAQFDAGTPTPGQAFLGGASVTVEIPTNASDTAKFSLSLIDLQVPGAMSPQSRTLNVAALRDLGPDVLDFIVGMIRQQVDALDLGDDTYRHIAGVAGILGFRSDPDVPALPFADLPTRGVSCLVEWIESILTSPTGLNHWLAQLALVVGGAPLPARSAVQFGIGPARLIAGLRVSPGAGGHPVLVPWIEIAWSPAAGADIVANVDILRADTATGALFGFPALRAEAVFGAEAQGGSALLTGTPALGSVRTGIRLDEHRHPEFSLTLHKVVIPGGRPFDLLDLSSPDAALDAVDAVLDGALATALDGFGAVGALLKQLLGIEPPGAVQAISATDLLADPLAVMSAYWRALLDDAAAMAEVLGSLRALVLGVPATPVLGLGTAVAPWRIDFATDIGVRLWREDSTIVVAIGAMVSTPAIDDITVAASLDLVLLRADLDAGHAVFASSASLSALVVPSGADPLSLDVGVGQLVFRGAGARLAWAPTRGLTASVVGEGLAFRFVDPRSGSPVEHQVPLPVIESDGTVSFSPDWDAVEAIVCALLTQSGSPIIGTVLDVLGWRGTGAHLRLADVVANAPKAVEVWAAAAVLDCGNLRTVLSAVAAVLSGGRVAGPGGAGTVEDPYRCSVAGSAQAPGLVVWTVPGCPPTPTGMGDLSGLGSLRGGLITPDGSAIVAALHQTAVDVPAVADLLEGRTRLAQGIDALFTRWAGTDGVTAAPSSMPTGATSIVIDGASYAELVAMGRSRLGVLDDLAATVRAVVHVGSAADWLTGKASSVAIDATVATPSPVPATGDGEWFVRLPSVAQAASLRNDHKVVEAQADVLTAVIGGRSEDLVVIAYGDVGAAAIESALGIAHVSAVVTIGVPWSPVSVVSLTEGLSGDALRLLDRLTPDALPVFDDQSLALTCSPLMRAWSMVRHAREVSSPVALPNAAARTLRAGLEVRAVFGSALADDVADGVTALVAQGIAERRQAAAKAANAVSGPPDEVHVGIDIPVLQTSVGGLIVGVGVTLEVAAIRSSAPRLSSTREVITTLRLAVEDGWLVGGPGGGLPDLELRWLDVRVHVPLTGGPGHAELVLHEAKALGASRERWVVRADADGVHSTTALPEVKVLLSEVAGRIQSASPDLAALLTDLGVLRADGLDANAIDRLLFDPVTTLRPAVTAKAHEIATSLKALIAVPPTGLAPTAFRVRVGGAVVDVDLATGHVTAAYQVDEVDAPALDFSVSIGPSGVTASAAVGDPKGFQVVSSVGAAGLSVELRAHPSVGSAPAVVSIYPSLDGPALRAMAQSLLPAVVIQAVITEYRTLATDFARDVLDEALQAVGLLDAALPNGARRVSLPFALFADPGAWLQKRVDPLGAVVAVLDALATVVVPTRGAGVRGWPISEMLTIDYAVVAGQLHLTAAVTAQSTVDARHIAVGIAGGLSISARGLVAPVVDAEATVDGTGLRLQVSPAISLDLIRELPATPIALYPAGAGLGPAVGAVAESAVRIMLNALVDHRTDAGSSAVKAVGSAVHELGAALDLLESDHFTDGRIQAFATSGPASILLARMPQLVAGGVSSLCSALDPTGTRVRVLAAAGGARRIDFGSGPSFHLILDGSTPSLEFGFSVNLVDRDGDPMGVIALERIVLSSTGVEFDIRGGPFLVKAGPMTLRPVVVALASITSTGFKRLLSVGLAIDDLGHSSAEFRWTFDDKKPYIAAITRDNDGVEGAPVTTVETVALRILGLAISLASGILADALDTVITDKATELLQGVVFTHGDRSIDPTIIDDLLVPIHLMHRLKVLAWNCATHAEPPMVTIDEAVTIALAAEKRDLDWALGVNVSLAAGKKFEFPAGVVKIALEVDDDWIAPKVNGGLSIFVLSGPDVDHLRIEPGFTIGGIGLHFTKAAGPLLDLGSIALDGISVHVYAQVDGFAAGGPEIGGGAHIKLDGLAFAPGGGQGTGVANNIMNDVGSASSSNRPAFSPSFAVQKHPGGDVGFRLRAGDLPGPWWIVIQRQLGPLYVDRIGFDAKEAAGRITEISLLFNGQLSIFGLQAAVDELKIKWSGGNVLSISSWSVDLMGLAISADMSGVVLAGGLLKTDDNGVVSYVGMLLGRFAAYGLSVFGGYTNDHGNASFFVFGAVNGPIGGPPAFFLTGLGGGLGINRGLRIPQDLAEFATFPFLQALDPASKPPAKPMDELHRLSNFFPHEMGSFWFAAGISFTCFSLVDGVAVIAVSFGNGLTIDLLGLARLALPRPGAALVSIELALLAHFSTSEGIFLIKAQLTDNSWLLYEDVRLTGGFAFALWWKGPNAGQFVLTMGGYHPSFHRDGYPDVPRLGIMWRVSDAIVIKGESYFALTSEAVMAGVGVEASLDFGWVWASIAFGADAIVYFDPFWYEASAFARISAGISIDLGFFGKLSISVTVGATVWVWGPDFAGRAEFEIGPCTVPVSFGSPRKVDPKLLQWPEFVAKYLEDDGGAAHALSSITGRGSLPASTGGKTGAPSSDGSEALPFLVFAEFEITFTTTIPTSSFEAAGSMPVPITLGANQPALLGLSPMGARDLKSIARITLELKDPVTDKYESIPGKLAELTRSFTTDAFPVGVWGLPKDSSVEVKPVPSGDIITAGKQITLVAGVKKTSVGPDIDYHQVRADRRPLPLLVTGNARKEFLRVAKNLPSVTPTTADEALTAASALLFADRQVDGLESVRGGHSALAQASFRQDRSAPPIFGSLTDGLAARNGDSGTWEVLDIAEEKALRVARAPFVAGYFTGGVGAAERPQITTVADGRLKRRPAPTLESVNGRLALHLPVTLSRAAAPSAAKATTVVATGGVPRTEAAGSTRSFRGGPVGTTSLQGLVDGVSIARTGPRRATRRRAENLPTGVLTGDVVVMQFPDADIDVDRERRPSVTIGGSARVTATLGGAVLLDADVVDGSIDVPLGTTHVTVHAGGAIESADGLAGWHDRSRVARISALAALASGCVISVDAVAEGPVMQWDTASSVVEGAREITTRFASSATCVAVALTGSAPTSLTPMQLELSGAKVATDSSGIQIPPVAVSLGETSVLVYSVVPEGAAVSVIVTDGADWTVSGVLGAVADPAELARRIARQGMNGVVAKILAVGQGSCTIAFAPAPTARPRRAPRRATKSRTRKAPR